MGELRVSTPYKSSIEDLAEAISSMVKKMLPFSPERLKKYEDGYVNSEGVLKIIKYAIPTISGSHETVLAINYNPVGETIHIQTDVLSDEQLFYAFYS